MSPETGLVRCARHPLPPEPHPLAVLVKSIDRVRLKDGCLYIDYRRLPPSEEPAHPLAEIVKGIAYVRRKEGKLIIGYRPPAPVEMRAARSALELRAVRSSLGVIDV